MFLAGSTDRWSWSEDASPALAFGVHALVRDGLRVAPFDQHGEGDGSLRALGLDARAWREWIVAVLGAQATLSDYARHPTDEPEWTERRATALAAAEALHRPGSLCPGSELLGERLDELWTAYAPGAEDWRLRMTTGERGLRNRLTSRDQQWLWKSLLPFHNRLPTISVFLVDYPAPVVMALPPTTCLIALGSTSADYIRQVLAAAEQLAASA